MHFESSIFLDCPAIKDLEGLWGKGSSEPGTVNRVDAVVEMRALDIKVDDDKSSEGEKSSETTSNDMISRNSETSVSPIPQVMATSLLLRGNPALPSTAKTLFFIPDGSGSCSSYAELPRIHPSITVVGLNSPFKMPEQFNCDVHTVCRMYIYEIRRRQPHGPHSLGGWSVGGIFAYHIAQQLITEGEEVSDLILIDSPVPQGLEHLSHRYYEYINDVGLLGEVNGIKKDPPKWLVSHFEASVNCLHDYHAVPIIPESSAPRTHIIWASDAIDKHCKTKFERRSDDPVGLDILVAMRTDFGPCG